jgi:arylsulfatase A-like enzyme
LVAKTAPDVTGAFLRWLDREPDRPFFGFLNYYDAHRPYFPPEPYRSRFLAPGVDLQPEARRRPADAPPWTPAELEGSVASYDGAIAYLDDQLEFLFTELARRGVLENTIVILTSDHGEEFAEHGMIDHGNSLYRASLEIPLILWWPGRIPSGAVIETPVTTRDIPATVMDLLGIPSHGFPGRSLSRTWAPGADSTVEPIYAEVRLAPRLPQWYPSSRGNMLGVLEEGLRYIRNGDGVPEVFDFHRDPAERRNLASDDSLAARLTPIRARLDTIHRRTIEPARPSP